MPKHTTLNRLRTAGSSMLAALLVAALVACGGGSSIDGGVVPTPTPVGSLNLIMQAPASLNEGFGPMTVDTSGNVYVTGYNYGLQPPGSDVYGVSVYRFKANAPVLSRIASAGADWVAMVAAQDSLYVASSGYQCQFCGRVQDQAPELLRVRHDIGTTDILLMGTLEDYSFGRVHYRVTGLDRDSDGNIFFTKAWSSDSPRGEILKYTPVGVVTSVATLPGALRNVKVGAAGALFVASCATDGCRVLRVAAGGAISQFGDGKFASISSLALDGKGNVYVADVDMNTVHRINAQGLVSTIAGVAGTRYGATGPLPASLMDPRWMSYSPSDNKLYLNSGGAIVSIDLPD